MNPRPTLSLDQLSSDGTDEIHKISCSPVEILHIDKNHNERKETHIYKGDGLEKSQVMRTSPVDDLPGASHANRPIGSVADQLGRHLKIKGKQIPTSPILDKQRRILGPWELIHLPQPRSNKNNPPKPSSCKQSNVLHKASLDIPCPARVAYQIFHSDNSTFYGMTPDMAGSWQCDGAWNTPFFLKRKLINGRQL